MNLKPCLHPSVDWKEQCLFSNDHRKEEVWYFSVSASNMSSLILIHHVIGKQRYLRDEHSLIVPTTYEYVRAVGNFKVILIQTWAVLRALCFLLKLSSEVSFEEYKNLNECLSASIKCYLISPCWQKPVYCSQICFIHYDFWTLRQPVEKTNHLECILGCHVFNCRNKRFYKLNSIKFGLILSPPMVAREFLSAKR